MQNKHAQVPGQISIFEYLDEIQATQPLHGNVLCKGQLVFLVEKRNILKYEVYGIFDVKDEETVVLISKDETASLYKHIPISELGISLFESEVKAEKMMLEQLEKCDCIMASDMNVKEFKAFTATHKNGALLTAFYAVLDNGYVYMKDYFSCGHLMKISAAQAEELLQEQVDSYTYQPSKCDCLPPLANMYKTTNPAESWEYAEISCPLTHVG